MKKLFSLILVFVMMMATLVAPVSAAPATSGTSTNTKGKITIGNAIKGETYSIYQLMVLESYDTTKPAYAYKATETWEGFFATTEAQKYFTVKDGYITLKAGVNNDDATAKAIAAAALAYAEANKIAATGSKVASEVVTDEETKAKNIVAEFNDLQLGYYLVQSSLGVVLSLNTTANEVVINEKNTGIPTLDKVIGTDLKISNGKIGDIVPYTITIADVYGKKNVVAHDKLDDTLTFNNGITVYLNGTTANDKVDAAEYTIGNADGETFTVKFKDSYIARLAKADKLYIKYTATINEKSVTALPDKNEAYLVYDNNQRTESVYTETYTYGLQFHKVDKNKNALTGAKFKLFDAETDGNEIKVIFVETKDGINYYRVATATELSSAVEMEAGIVQVDGLDITKNYYLQETVAPVGFNKLATRVAVKIAEKAENATTYVYQNTEVINTTGVVLPSTGGMGTVLFVTIGSMMVMAAGIVLITKFRMTREN